MAVLFLRSSPGEDALARPLVLRAVSGRIPFDERRGRLCHPVGRPALWGQGVLPPPSVPIEAGLTALAGSGEGPDVVGNC